VRGCGEKGNISTPLKLAIRKQIERMLEELRSAAAQARMTNAMLENLHYVFEHGTERTQVADWTWPGTARQ
jgi:xylulose-5-phosphate/fructose-6-phosphate phosphoketolase